MEVLLDQLLDLLEMHQLNVVRVNELIGQCLGQMQLADEQQLKTLMAKRNVIINRVRMIDEAFNRSQIAFLGFERLRPAIEKYYEQNH